jgi:EmrB/QacA subfamily drug resistance transporter
MTTSEVRAHRRSKFRVLLTASLVSSLIMLDSNIVAVALPTIGRSPHAGFAGIQWIISAYVLTYAALLLAAGNFADLHGRRLAMLFGLIVFAVASAVCGLVPSAMILNLARAFQGLGGALLLTASLAIISHDFSGEERASAFAFWGASLGIALAVGPVLGGMITNFAGWRWIFLVNLPLCATLIAATMTTIEESKDPDAKQLDLPGIVTFSFGLAILIWALIDGNDDGWTSASIVSRIAIAAAAFAAFVFVELRQPRPMVDFALFRQRTFLGSVLAMIGYGASAQVMVFFLPLFLQNAYAFRPMSAGFAMLPFALPMVLAPRVTSGLATRFSGRALLTVGVAITAAANVMFWAVARAQLSYDVFVGAMIVAGCGAGLLNGQTVKVLGSAVPPERAGMASGLASTTRFIGVLVSVAGMGRNASACCELQVCGGRPIGWSRRRYSGCGGQAVTSGDLQGMLGSVTPGARDILHTAGLSAFAGGFAAASLFAAMVALIAAILTFLLVGATPSHAEKRPCKFIDCRDPL